MSLKKLTYLLLLLLGVGCSPSDDGPEIKLDNMLHIGQLGFESSVVPKGEYNLGLFLMKSDCRSIRPEQIPDNSFYFNIHDYIETERGGNVRLEHRTNSTDQKIIDTLILRERTFMFAYSPFLKTMAEPSSTNNAYYGSQIPIDLHGGIDVMCTPSPEEIPADNLSGQDIKASITLRHLLSQLTFYFSNNTENDTITISSLRILTNPGSKRLISRVYLDAFNSKINIDSSFTTNSFITYITPGLTLLPKESSKVNASMMIVPANIGSDSLTTIKVQLGITQKINGNDAIGYTEPMGLPTYNYKSGEAYELVAGIIPDGKIFYTSNWLIAGWKDQPTANETIGGHVSSNAYVNVVPWHELETKEQILNGKHYTYSLMLPDNWKNEKTDNGSISSSVMRPDFRIQTWETINNDVTTNTNPTEHFLFELWQHAKEYYDNPIPPDIHYWNVDKWNRNETSETINGRN